MNDERDSRRGPRSASGAGAGFESRGKPGGQTLTGAFPPPPSDWQVQRDAVERVELNLSVLTQHERALAAALAQRDGVAARSLLDTIDWLRPGLRGALRIAKESGVAEVERERLQQRVNELLQQVQVLAVTVAASASGVVTGPAASIPASRAAPAAALPASPATAPIAPTAATATAPIAPTAAMATAAPASTTGQRDETDARLAPVAEVAEVAAPVSDIERVGRRLRGANGTKTVRVADATPERDGIAQPPVLAGQPEQTETSALAATSERQHVQSATAALAADSPASATGEGQHEQAATAALAADSPASATGERQHVQSATAALADDSPASATGDVQHEQAATAALADDSPASATSDVQHEQAATAALADDSPASATGEGQVQPRGEPVQAQPPLATTDSSSHDNLNDVDKDAITVDVAKLAVRYRASWLLVNPRERALLGLQRLRRDGAISWASDAALARVVAWTTWDRLPRANNTLTLVITPAALAIIGLPPSRHAVAQAVGSGIEVALAMPVAGLAANTRVALPEEERARLAEALVDLTGLRILDEPEHESAVVGGAGVVVRLSSAQCAQRFGPTSWQVVQRRWQQRERDGERETPEDPRFTRDELPARLTQHGGLVISGDSVPFEVAVDWPLVEMHLLSPAARARFTQRKSGFDVRWTVTRVAARAGASPQIYTSHGESEALKRSIPLQLDRKETSGVFTVEATIGSNHWRPRTVATQVEVKTAATRMAELRAEANGVGDGALAGEGLVARAHDFDIGLVDDKISKRGDDHGQRFDGQLDELHQRRTLAERARTRDDKLAQLSAARAYLKSRAGDRDVDDAIASFDAEIQKLRDAGQAIEAAAVAGWQPFEVRGTYLSRTAGVASGALELYGEVQRLPLGGASMLQVRIRDLSRRFAPEIYVFSGMGKSFEAALESAFVDFCKAYPDGRVALLVEAMAAAPASSDATDDAAAPTLRSTGAVIGFELPTTSRWKSIKAKVFAPAIQTLQGAATAVALIFAPEIAVPLVMAQVAMGSVQTIDDMVEKSRRGQLHTRDLAMGFGQLAMNVLPVLGQARVVGAAQRAELALATREAAALQAGALGGQAAQSAERAALRAMTAVVAPSPLPVLALAGAEFAGNALLVSGQTYGLLRQLQAEDVAAIGDMYVEFQRLAASTHPSDPELKRLQDAIEARAIAVRRRTQQAFTTCIGDQLAMWVPMQMLTVMTPPSKPHAERSAEGGEHAGSDDGGDPTRTPRSTRTREHEHEHEASEPASQDPPRTDGVEPGKDGAESQEPPPDAVAIDPHAIDRQIAGPKHAQTDLHNQFMGNVAPERFQEVRRYGTAHTHSGASPPKASLQQYEPNSVVGHVPSVDDGRHLLRRLVTGDRTALHELGYDSFPETLGTNQVEWGLGRRWDGVIAVVLGSGGDVDWAKLPHIKPLSHSHPLNPRAKLLGPKGDGVVSIDELGDLSADLTHMFPSAADISVMARGGIRDHYVHTPFVSRGGDRVSNPHAGEAAPTVDFVIEKAKYIGRWESAEDLGVYRATIIAKAEGRVLWRGEIWAIDGGASFLYRKPPKLAAGKLGPPKGAFQTASTVKYLEAKGRFENFRAVVTPEDLRGAPPAAGSGTAGHARSKHGISNAKLAEILNAPERVFTGINRNGREVDIYCKSGNAVITVAGNKHLVITAHGTESKLSGEAINPAKWQADENYVEVRFDQGNEVIYPNRDRWEKDDWI